MNGLISFFLTGGLFVGEVLAIPVILVNQLGYRPDDRKLVVVKDPPVGEYEVWNMESNRLVLRATLKAVGMKDENTGDIVFTLDLSDLRTAGVYQIRFPHSDVTSPEFRIGVDVYDSLCLATLESFYFQRCGTQVHNGTVWKHPACHLFDATLFDNHTLTKEVVGGWHDAGDYGKFVATATVSTAFLLYLYELQPHKFTDGQLKIPEAGNGVPDVLDEVRWELTWLLKMQTPGGGVYHKVSTKKWTGEYLPHQDPDTRYIFQESSTATGAFAAVCALGARVFRELDKEFSRALLKAAILAWNYLEKNRTIVPPGGFRNPAGVEGGEYGDSRDDDERLWAAVELLRTTGNVEYHSYFLTQYRNLGGITYPVSWEHVQNFAYYSYLKIPVSQTDYAARSLVIATLTGYSDDLIQRTEQNGYRLVLRSDQFYWGSNSVVAGYAFDLIQAYEATKLRRYLNAALDQFHYLLGRNTFNKSFVTGVGSDPVRYPYHQFSMMLHAGKPVPGMLVGGPNRGSRLQGKVISEYPGKCYEDYEKNYFVNEVAINYTAPLVFLSGYLSDFGKQHNQ